MRAALTTAFIVLSSAAWAQSPGLDRFAAQASQCPEGTAFNVQTGQCVGRGAFFDQQGFIVGGGLLTVGAVGAIILANNGKKKTKSP